MIKKKLAVKDQNVAVRKAKNVKGGPIYMKYDMISAEQVQGAGAFSKIDVALPTGALNFKKAT